MYGINKPSSYHLPVVIEQGNKGERSYDIYSRLLKDRIILLKEILDEETGNLIVAQLLHLESEDPNKDINFYISSPGGYMYDALAIYDTIQSIRPKVNTICSGWAASAAALLLCGATGKRFALPNSFIMIHQPMSGFYGQATEIAIQNAHLQRLKDKMIDILSKHTQQPREKIALDIERDYWMTALEAKEYGIVDDFVVQPKRK